jgi:predicted DNA-binding protein with PD1-like motif
MKFTEARQGRIFVIRLEDGETVHEEIERLAVEQSIAAAALILLGGAAKGSKLVVGPQRGDARPIEVVHILDNTHEVAGTGTLFPDEDGKPVLHMHMACGRNAETITGCIRSGVSVWQVMEIVLFELIGTDAKRIADPSLGFSLLDP